MDPDRWHDSQSNGTRYKASEHLAEAEMHRMELKACDVDHYGDR